MQLLLIKRSLRLVEIKLLCPSIFTQPLDLTKTLNDSSSFLTIPLPSLHPAPRCLIGDLIGSFLKNINFKRTSEIAILIVLADNKISSPRALLGIKIAASMQLHSILQIHVHRK